MDIDIERLKLDPDYWDECGALEDATHYCASDRIFGSDLKPCKDCIPRPTKQEWEGGLPPVGVECEVYPYFARCRICCEYEGGVIVHNLHDDGFFHAKNDGEYRFRPLKSQHERQLEELEELLSEYSFDIGEDYSKAADAILARYNLEPKP